MLLIDNIELGGLPSRSLSSGEKRMKKLAVFAVLFAAFAFTVNAHAQCAFDGPAKAKGMKTSLIRSFAGCPSITFASPNSSTGGGVPTCAPPYAHSSFLFHNKNGSCSFSTSAKLESPCSNSQPGDCMNLSIKASCKGVLESDGVTPVSGSGWSISTVTRATLNDPDNDDMTVIDFPVQIPLSVAVNGSFNSKTNTHILLDNLGLPALPACTQVEVISLAVQDPDGNPFARIGAGTRPKGQ
jgi:hypothetical protein